MPSMVRFFGELAATGAAHQSRRASIRRGSEIGERLEHTIHLTSQSTTPSAHDSGEGFHPLQMCSGIFSTSHYCMAGNPPSSDVATRQEVTVTCKALRCTYVKGKIEGNSSSRKAAAWMQTFEICFDAKWSQSGVGYRAADRFPTEFVYAITIRKSAHIDIGSRILHNNILFLDEAPLNSKQKKKIEESERVGPGLPELRYAAVDSLNLKIWTYQAPKFSGYAAVDSKSRRVRLLAPPDSLYPVTLDLEVYTSSYLSAWTPGLGRLLATSSTLVYGGSVCHFRVIYLLDNSVTIQLLIQSQSWRGGLPKTSKFAGLATS
ncbi:hypothetical protein BaRGS_00001323 [Batillaria attramentaria]|uniref:Uncharacterized protein n=1 Tax=Batillaria attramentaria TaxID=370345 RepID=A0ABD0M7C7_9CAEN